MAAKGNEVDSDAKKVIQGLRSKIRRELKLKLDNLQKYCSKKIQSLPRIELAEAERTMCQTEFANKRFKVSKIEAQKEQDGSVMPALLALMKA